MKNRWLTALLVSSLALNLALLGAAAWRRLHAPQRPAFRPPSLRLGLPLGEEQRRHVQPLLRQFKLRSIIAREDILAKRVQILEALGDPGADAAAVKGLTDELNKLENDLNQDFIDTLLAVSEKLEPPQRLNLLYRLSRSWYMAAPETTGPGPANRDRDPRDKGGHHEP